MTTQTQDISKVYLSPNEKSPVKQAAAIRQLLEIVSGRNKVSALVTEFGADPSGNVDSTNAIQNAINSLPASGGEILFPPGTYTISSTLTIGNGSSSTFSTTYGVVLRGIGQPVMPAVFASYPSTPSVLIKWIGPGGGVDNMLDILGPLQGWGIENIGFDGGGGADKGLLVISAQNGFCKNLSFKGMITAGIYSTTVPQISGVNTDSFHNCYDNIIIAGGSTTYGVVLTGNANGGSPNSDTDYNVFTNCVFSIGGTAAIYLQVCDTNFFYDVQQPVKGTVLDYSVNASFPTMNGFYGLDTNTISVTGTGNTVVPNYVKGTALDGLPQANVAGLDPDLPTVIGGTGIHLTAQSTSIGATTLFSIGSSQAGLYRISVYLGITTTGNNVNVSAGLSWNDSNSQTASTATIAANGLNFTQNIFVIFLAASQTVQYSTTVSAPIGTGRYQLHIMAERFV